MSFLFGVIEEIPKIPFSSPMPNARSLGVIVTWHSQDLRTIQSMGKPLLHSIDNGKQDGDDRTGGFDCVEENDIIS